jgi:D-aspartate ligase
VIGRSSPTPAENSAGIPILIVGLAGLSMHHGALGAVRSAGRHGISVFHAHRGRRSAVDSSRYSRGSLDIPSHVSVEGALDILREFGREHGETILLPVDDASAVFIDDHSSALGHGFIFPNLPSGLARRLVDKRELQRLCDEHDIPTPRAMFPSSEDELVANAEEMGLPLVIKLIDKSAVGLSFADGEGGAIGRDWAPSLLIPSVRIVHSRAELLDAYREMSWLESNVMLQEYVPDGENANWMFNGYFDAGSDCRVSFTGRKIRQSPAYAGATSLGACEPNATVAEITRRFMRAVAYRGIVDIDYRFDSRDGQYKLLDVNPRIGSSFRLFVASDGTDVLRAMYLDVTGQAIPAVAAPEKRRWIVELQDLSSSLTLVRHGDLSLWAWIGSLRHIDETAWWARDDPQPLLTLSGRLLAGRASRLLGRLRGRRRDAR